MSKIVIVGKNGAGKGTRVGKFMAGRENRFQVMAMSGLLGKVKDTDPELWAKIDAIMKAGELVPDNIILDIIGKELEATDKNIIFDGFPRTVNQAEAMVTAGLVPDAIVEIYVDDEVVVQRAKDRVVCSKCKKPYTLNDYDPPKQAGICDICGAPLVRRPDDEEELVRKRLKQYQEQTYPVIEILKEAGAVYYRVDNGGNSAAQDEFNEILNMF